MRLSDVPSKVCRVYQPELEAPHFNKDAPLFRVPIERFLDLRLLRSKVAVLTLLDFLVLNTPPDAIRPIETTDGAFVRKYLNHGEGITLAKLDPPDWAPPDIDLSFDAPTAESVRDVAAGMRVSDEVVGSAKFSALATKLDETGLALGYTFAPSSLVFDRTVIVPASSFDLPSRARESDATILHLAGRADWIWAPPILRSPADRTRFFDLAVRWMRPPPFVFAVAKRLSGRLVVHSEGRQWIATHGSNNAKLVLPALRDARSAVADIYASASTNLTRAIAAMDQPTSKDAFLILPSRPSHAFAPDGLLPVDIRAEAWKADVRDVYWDTALPAPGEPFPSIGLIDAGALTLAEDLLTPGDRDDVAWLSVFSDFVELLALVVASRAAIFVSLAPGPSHDGRFAGACAELRHGFGLPVDSTWLAYADGR